MDVVNFLLLLISVVVTGLDTMASAILPVSAGCMDLADWLPMLSLATLQSIRKQVRTQLAAGFCITKDLTHLFEISRTTHM